MQGFLQGVDLLSYLRGAIALFFCESVHLSLTLSKPGIVVSLWSRLFIMLFVETPLRLEDTSLLVLILHFATIFWLRLMRQLQCVQLEEGGSYSLPYFVPGFYGGRLFDGHRPLVLGTNHACRPAFNSQKLGSSINLVRAERLRLVYRLSLDEHVHQRLRMCSKPYLVAYELQTFSRPLARSARLLSLSVALS